MRIVGTLLNEDQARQFCAVLKQQKIETSCDMTFDAATGHMSYPIWVLDEDQIQKAMELFTRFQANPKSAEFNVIASVLEPQDTSLETEPVPEVKKKTMFTSFILSLCIFVFILNWMQEAQMEQQGFSDKTPFITPIAASLLYDEPVQIAAVEEKIEKLPPAKALPPEIATEVEQAVNTSYWKGLYQWLLLTAKSEDSSSAFGPMFTSIKQGQIWRLVSPAVLHLQSLHILFNMMWLWILSRPIEMRIGAFRTLLLSLVIAVISNTAQYLMGGPLFLGYSGVIMGLAGFVWMRERIAPWEGYPLHRSTILFLVLFVLAMAALQVGSFFAWLLTPIQFVPGIANTAHIAGALIGIVLGRLRWFAARIH